MSPEYAKEWVSKAQADMIAAGRALQDSKKNQNQAEIACFHAQQCVEKYLKAILSHHGHPIDRIHDLLALARLCKKHGFPSSRLESALRVLNQFAVEIRYPGASATVAEARHALVMMRVIVKAARNTLTKRG